jgi:hypothetical protein
VRTTDLAKWSGTHSATRGKQAINDPYHLRELQIKL